MSGALPPGEKMNCPLKCTIPKEGQMIPIPRPRHAWTDIIICPNEECDVEGGRCFLYIRPENVTEVK